MMLFTPSIHKATRRHTTHSTHSLCIDAVGHPIKAENNKSRVFVCAYVCVCMCVCACVCVCLCVRGYQKLAQTTSLCIVTVGQPIQAKSHATLHNPLYTLTLYRYCRSAHPGIKPRDATQLTLHTHSVSMPLVTPFSTKPRDASNPSIPQPPNHVFTSSAYPGETCRGTHTQHFVFKNARMSFTCSTKSSPLWRIQVKPAGARTQHVVLENACMSFTCSTKSSPLRRIQVFPARAHRQRFVFKIAQFCTFRIFSLLAPPRFHFSSVEEWIYLKRGAHNKFAITCANVTASPSHHALHFW